MFSNVNEVVEQLRLAELGNYLFAINWKRSCYRDKDYSGDPWSYYFEPVFGGLTLRLLRGQDVPKVSQGGHVNCSQTNIITPCAEEGNYQTVMLPHDRHAAHRLIKKYLRLKPAVVSEINTFSNDHMTGSIIGLHIRGPRRIGRSNRLGTKRADPRSLFAPDGRVPYELFFSAADKALQTRPDAKILVCSDSSVVIDTVQAYYGDRVIVYDATRSSFGEMHVRHLEENAGLAFPKRKLGLDVLVEAYLLSQCDFFIHGIGNVSNFVLCNAPDMPHSYIEA